MTLICPGTFSFAWSSSSFCLGDECENIFLLSLLRSARADSVVRRASACAAKAKYDPNKNIFSYKSLDFLGRFAWKIPAGAATVHPFAEILRCFCATAESTFTTPLIYDSLSLSRLNAFFVYKHAPVIEMCNPAAGRWRMRRSNISIYLSEVVNKQKDKFFTIIELKYGLSKCLLF